MSNCVDIDDDEKPVVSILNYGAGNVRSLINAIIQCGFSYKFIGSIQDIDQAQVLIFPGVGSFGYVMQSLRKNRYDAALKRYLASGRPFLGICVGMQVLFEGSTEDPSEPGLSYFSGTLRKFNDANKAVPCIGWNEAAVVHCGTRDATTTRQEVGSMLGPTKESPSSHLKYYFVHSYYVPYTAEISVENENLGLYEIAAASYKDEPYIAAVAKNRLLACQFHPEKSGQVGIDLLQKFLHNSYGAMDTSLEIHTRAVAIQTLIGSLSSRIIACLDVRANEYGDLVVTKGDQYDVRESDAGIRNLGKPVQLARRYYEDGADEICFLNIVSFRNCPAKDLPMLEVLREATKYVFVPITVGGGIADHKNPDGTMTTALEIAKLYFEAGADKISLGSAAVYAAEKYYQQGRVLKGTSAIEQISTIYGRQAVVISVDPKKVYVHDPSLINHTCVELATPGPNGEKYAWYQCTVKGGREIRDIDAHQLVKAAESMGAGEILLNCIDQDGTMQGFDCPFIYSIKKSVRIPVIASSGAGTPEHFEKVFRYAKCDAALAAGIFHRQTCPIQNVKKLLKRNGLIVRDSA